MVCVAEIVNFLEQFAPPALAEDWDNVGLLVGDRACEVNAIMTCLTLTSDVAGEAIRRKAGIVVTHHPVLFRPVQALTSDTTEGQMLLQLIGAGIAVYSPHTGYDSAKEGINQQLAEMFQLEEIDVLRPPAIEEHADESGEGTAGAGRCGKLPSPQGLAEFNELVKRNLGVEQLQYVGDESAVIEKVGIACGSAAEFMREAKLKSCDVLLTGEARFHACLEAVANGIVLVLPGHYATERPAVERLAEILLQQFPQLDVRASETEADPLKYG